jgi:hypothetical protein
MLEDPSPCFTLPQVHRSPANPLVDNSSSTPYSLRIKVNYKDFTSKATSPIALLLLRHHYTTTTTLLHTLLHNYNPPQKSNSQRLQNEETTLIPLLPPHNHITTPHKHVFNHHYLRPPNQGQIPPRRIRAHHPRVHHLRRRGLRHLHAPHLLRLAPLQRARRARPTHQSMRPRAWCHMRAQVVRREEFVPVLPGHTFPLSESSQGHVDISRLGAP